MHKQNISFQYLISNEYLINSFNSFDKNLNAKSVYLVIVMRNEKMVCKPAVFLFMT